MDMNEETLFTIPKKVHDKREFELRSSFGEFQYNGFNSASSADKTSVYV